MNDNFSASIATMRHANTRMLNRYLPWIDYRLDITFGKAYDLCLLPSQEQANAQLRHLRTTLNCAIWSNRWKFDDKCNILFIPILEGAKGAKRIHAHILLGNVKSQCAVLEHLNHYLPKSRWCLPRYELHTKYDDGVTWYVTKETNSINHAAINWNEALIPRPLMP